MPLTEDLRPVSPIDCEDDPEFCDFCIGRLFWGNYLIRARRHLFPNFREGYLCRRSLSDPTIAGHHRCPPSLLGLGRYRILTLARREIHPAPSRGS